MLYSGPKGASASGPNVLVLVALIPPAMPLQVSTMVLQSRVSVITLHSIFQLGSARSIHLLQYHGWEGGALMGKQTKYGGNKKDDSGGGALVAWWDQELNPPS